MTGRVGTPTDKSGPAYRHSTRRQLLKYLGVAGVGFGAGTAVTTDDSAAGVVTAFAGNETQTETVPSAPTETHEESTPMLSTGGEPAVEEITKTETVDGHRKYVAVTVVVSNPLETDVRRGLYGTIQHEPYESAGDRVVDLPARSRHEYLLRVPNLGQIRSAILTAVQRDDYELDVELGDLPERFGDP